MEFPSAFSPNGDQLNDYFIPNINGNIVIESLDIFDRWGSKIYTYASGSLGWDGRYQNLASPTEIYTYILRYRQLYQLLNKSGEVMLVR